MANQVRASYCRKFWESLEEVHLALIPSVKAYHVKPEGCYEMIIPNPDSLVHPEYVREFLWVTIVTERKHSVRRIYAMLRLRNHMYMYIKLKTGYDVTPKATLFVSSELGAIEAHGMSSRAWNWDHKSTNTTGQNTIAART
jgi:hypothetical protein